MTIAHRLEVHKPEADTLRLAVAWIVDDGLTTGEVCRRLNAAGLLTRHSREWNHSNLRRCLRQRVLVGEIIWANTEKTHRSYVPSGKYGPPVLLHFEPIIPEERYAALQIALDTRATGKRASNKPYPLSGRLLSPCGAAYGGVYRKDRDLRQYRCNRRQWTATGAPRCSDPRLNAEELEKRVWDSVRTLLTDKRRLLHMAQDYLGLRVSQVETELDEKAALVRRIADLTRAQQQTLVELIRRGLDADAIEAAVETVALDLAAAKRRLEEIELWEADSRAESQRLLTVCSLAETAAERLQGMTLAERGEVLRLLDVRVAVLDASRSPTIRIVGSLCHEQLLGNLKPGDFAVAGTPPGAPRPPRSGRAACAAPP